MFFVCITYGLYNTYLTVCVVLISFICYYSSSYPMDFDGSLGTGSDSMFVSDYYDDGYADNTGRHHRERSPLAYNRRRGQNNGF